ncbi:hypothetical protein AOLI_G00058500 [Acnodon oligacanthus]
MSVRRSLPSWMTDCGSGRRREEQPLGSGARKRPETSAESRPRKKRPERLMMYWMNERELMDTALGVLKKSDAKLKTDAACPALAAEVSVIPETDSEEEPDSDAQERNCDSDVNVAEQETVPYITCIEKDRFSRRSDSAGDHRPIHSQAQPELEGNSQRTKSDPEALQLVREIFFS